MALNAADCGALPYLKGSVHPTIREANLNVAHHLFRRTSLRGCTSEEEKLSAKRARSLGKSHQMYANRLPIAQ